MLSIAVPLYNEEESVAPLVAAIREAMEELPDSWELLLVDDGSVDDTAVIADALSAEDSRIRVIRLARNYGQSAAMQAGFDLARGDVIVTMDGDLQNDPRDIPRLLAKLDEGHDLVTGYREQRKDPLLTRKIPSWIANRIIRSVTGVPIRDNGCSLKAYRREVLERIRLYSDMHRFIPAISASVAGASIAELPVRHHARRFGSSKYGLSRVGAVLGDLLTITMIRSFRERPLVLFSIGAIAALLASLVPTTVFAAAVAGYFGDASLVVLAGISLCLVGLASFLFMLGLIAETVLRAQQEMDPLDRLIVRVITA